MNPRTLLFLILGLLTAIRLVLIGQFELFPDEAYYFMWSERMDWCFFSKGPGVASAIWLGTHLFGAGEFGVRVLSPLLALGTSAIVWTLARRLHGESVAFWSALTFNLLPIFNVGSIVMTIDPLSIFFWSAALLTLWRALERGGFSAWWPASGALIGLGFLSKYTNAMQLVSLVLLLALTPKYRRELRGAGFWSMLAVFAVCTLPSVIWNAGHGWPTLGHLTARGGLDGESAFNPGELFEFIGVHFGVYSPLVFAAMALALFLSWGKAAHSFKTRFLLAFSVPLFAMYLWLSLKQAGEANWTAPASVSLGILAVAMWHERFASSAFGKRYAVAALAIAAAMSVALPGSDLLRAAGVPWPYSRDPGKRMRGWRTAAAQVESLRADFEKKHGAPVFLIANEHEVAAALAFYMRDKRAEGPAHPPIYIPASPAFEDQFSFWPRYDQLEDATPEQIAETQRALHGGVIFTEEQGISRFRGRTALYITDRAEEKAPSSIQDGFESWEMIAVLDQERRGQPLRQLRIFSCTNYLDPGVR